MFVPPKLDIFPESRGTPLLTAGALMVRAPRGAPARPSSPSSNSPFLERTKQIMKFFFPSHLPFPGLSKECQESDKLKAADYCGFKGSDQ